MIAILDYGSGNIRSVRRACEQVGLETSVTSDYVEALNADGLVVPGVGAFGSCMRQLSLIKGDQLIRERFERGRAILGICVGLQILFESSDESPEKGIGIFSGGVERLTAPVLPHIGWNEITPEKGMRLTEGIEDQRFYFVHSYAAKSISGATTAMSEYGETFLAALELDALSGVQFHPEKSGDAGLQLLANWSANL